MPAPYSIGELDNATDVYEIAKAVNGLSNGLYGGMLLVVTALFFLAIFRNSDNFPNIFLGTSFLTVLVALGLWITGLIGVHILIFPLILLMISIFVKVWGGG